MNKRCLFVIASLLAVLLSFSSAFAAGDKKISNLEDLRGCDFAQETGGVFTEVINEYYKEDQKVDNYNMTTDAIAAVLANKSFAALGDLPVMELAEKIHPELLVMPEYYMQDRYAFTFKKGNPLKDEFNKAIAKLKAEGLDEKMRAKWISPDGWKQQLIEQDWEGKNGTLKYWLNAIGEPMAYIGRGGVIKGYSVDYVLHIARELDYKVEVTETNWDGMIGAMESGKADVCGSATSITEERKKSMDFSDVFYEGAVAVVIRREDASEELLKAVDGVQEDGKITSLADLAGHSFAVTNGTNFVEVIEEYYKEQGPQKMDVYSSVPDSTASVVYKKSDVVISDLPLLEAAAAQNREIIILPEHFIEDPYGYGFQKGSPLRDEFNKAMAKLKAEGFDEKMHDKWIAKSSGEPELIEQDWEGKNGTLRYWFDAAGDPMAYLGEGGQFKGMAIDYVLHVAKEMDYRVDLHECDFDGTVPAVISGKADICGAGFSITEERAKSIDFSDPFYMGAVVAGIHRDNASEELLKAVGASEKTADSDGKIASLDDLTGKVFAVEQGAIFGDVVDEYYADKGPQNKAVYNSSADCITAVLTGKCDATVSDLPVLQAAEAIHRELVVLPEYFTPDNYGFGFRKGSPLRDEFNKAMAKLKAEGLDEQLRTKWISEDGSKQELIEQDWEGKNGTINYWTNAAGEPMAYLSANGLKGYTIDYVLHIAREMDYKVEITECAFDGMIPALLSGKADMCGSAFSITEERAKSIDFSDVFYEGAVAVIVRRADVDPSLLGEDYEEEYKAPGIFDQIITSFKRTFIEENRWQVFGLGLLRTLGITIGSALLGTLLGFLFYSVIRRLKVGVIGGIENVFGVISGIPTVVLVMLFFYLIFGKSSLSGFVVSIFAFSLSLGINVYSILKHGVETLSPTQAEGALALGFTENETFLNVLLPQAIRNVLPLYSDELVSLIKATAIVGYIAVQDLTRASDLIRAKTFDAFYPLIFTAIVYYLAERLLVAIVRYASRHTNPFNRSKKQVLKGIEYDKD